MSQSKELGNIGIQDEVVQEAQTESNHIVPPRTKSGRILWSRFPDNERNAYFEQEMRAGRETPVLKGAIKKYAEGGLRAIKETAGLQVNAPRGYWTVDRIEEEAKKALQLYGSLSTRVLESNGRNDLSAAISTCYPGRFNGLLAFLRREEQRQRIERFEKHVEDHNEEYDNESINRVRRLVELSILNRIPYALFTDINDYLLYFDFHPEWHGLSLMEMRKSTDVALRSFVTQFLKFLNKHNIENEEKRKYLAKITSNLRGNWQSLKTLEDWKREFNGHSSWAGMSQKQLIEQDIEGSSNFVASFSTWVYKNFVRSQRRSIKMTLFHFEGIVSAHTESLEDLLGDEYDPE